MSGPWRINRSDQGLTLGITATFVNLTCGVISRGDLVVVTWKIRPRTGNHCALAYRTDQNKTDRTNCSERMDWKSSPETDSALQIRQVTLTDEGCYICEAVTSGGNSHRTYTLTVLVPPEVTLTCDSNGTAVCKAAAGKPAAQISWDPNGDPRTDQLLGGSVSLPNRCHPALEDGARLSCQKVNKAESSSRIFIPLLREGRCWLELHFSSIRPCLNESEGCSSRVKQQGALYLNIHNL
uniref:Ig-like domain-containing protein n=1 Tax=Gopherus agassizii TaxID=38772 RepID=A0A452GLT2_9SAUR